MPAMMRLGVAAFFALALATAASAGAPAPPLAVFPIELWDTSGEGAKPGQAERLRHATETLAKTLEQTGRYSIVDLTPYREEIEKTAPRYACNGCWKPIVDKAGAQFAALSTIHKVSSLISSFDISITDLKTEKLVAYASGQFRGDTDEAYTRAIAFLVKDRLFSSEAAPAAAH
jgi:Protein of unknown function (DUF2380)